MFSKPDVGDMGFVNIYEGEQDEIDRSNRTFGLYNKLTDRDKYLGNSVEVLNVGKEGPLQAFYRESVPIGSYNSEEAVLLLSGLPASSYSWRDVLPRVSECGYRAIAPDWLGFGFSDKAAPNFVFSYTPDAYVAFLKQFLVAVGVKSLKCIVVQGWLGCNGLLFALRNSDIVQSIYILNTPLPPANPKLPFTFAKWGAPAILGDAFAQDALSIERAIEGGSKYVLAVADAEVYRRPSMLSGDAGFSLAAATRKLSMSACFSEMMQLADWKKPMGIGWGLDDRYLKVDVADRFVKELCPSCVLNKLEGAGHFAQEDFGERVADNLVKFLKAH